MIEPGAAAARTAYNLAMSEAAATDLASDGVLVLATEATVQSHAYARACAEHGLRAFEKACPLLVPLVEEGWIDNPVTEEVARIYLAEALAQAAGQKIVPHTILLGCTHYPLIQPLLECVLLKHFAANGPMGILDSAEATARHVKHLLGERAMTSAPGKANAEVLRHRLRRKVQRLGSRFLGCPIDRVQHVDLGG